MLTRQEGERLAQSINAMRPDWPVSSLLTLIGKRKERALMDLALELMYVAIDPDTKSPARIDADGPWKRLNHSATAGIQYKVITDNDCAICTRPQHAHPLLNDDHPWEPQHARVESHAPTPEQRAAIDKATAEAQTKVTAAKEAAEKAREPTPVDQVLARHQNSNDDTTTEMDEQRTAS
jgi:hypothetical protein